MLIPKIVLFSNFNRLAEPVSDRLLPPYLSNYLLIIFFNSQYSPEVQALVDAANTARDDFRTAERACNDVDHDVQVIYNLQFSD